MTASLLAAVAALVLFADATLTIIWPAYWREAIGEATALGCDEPAQAVFDSVMLEAGIGISLCLLSLGLMA